MLINKRRDSGLHTGGSVLLYILRFCRFVYRFIHFGKKRLRVGCLTRLHQFLNVFLGRQNSVLATQVKNPPVSGDADCFLCRTGYCHFPDELGIMNYELGRTITYQRYAEKASGEPTPSL